MITRVYFDFCETLVDIQSADEFVRYVMRVERVNMFYRFCLTLLVTKLGSKITSKLFSNKFNTKYWALKHLEGVEFEKMEYYSENFSKILKDKFLISSVYEELLSYKRQGCEVVIVSGGYDIYISKMFPGIVDKVVATKLNFDGKVFTGEIDGLDCLSDNKIIMIDKCCGPRSKTSETVVYSDSETDLPLFSLGDKKVVVSKNIAKKWVLKYESFEEKIWRSN